MGLAQPNSHDINNEFKKNNFTHLFPCDFLSPGVSSPSPGTDAYSLNNKMICIKYLILFVSVCALFYFELSLFFEAFYFSFGRCSVHFGFCWIEMYTDLFRFTIKPMFMNYLMISVHSPFIRWRGCSSFVRGLFRWTQLLSHQFMLCGKSFSGIPKNWHKISDCQIPIKNTFLAIFYLLIPNNHYFKILKTVHILLMMEESITCLSKHHIPHSNVINFIYSLLFFRSLCLNCETTVWLVFNFTILATENWAYLTEYEALDNGKSKIDGVQHFAYV